MTCAPGVHATGAERDRFVLAQRPARIPLDPWRHQGVLVEPERAADGRVVQVATIFLTGRECPWRCVMCDLWRHTIQEDTPSGALVYQLEHALGTVRSDGHAVDHVKLYNAGSFFDPRAVPDQDYEPLAARLAGVAHVIVESHPALIGPRLTRFRAALAHAAGDDGRPGLEVAMGLETAHPDALMQLHKGFSLDQFRRGADRVLQLGATLRVFLLVGVPFIAPAEQAAWLTRSVACAFACGASAVSLIPTRSGNGAVEALAAAGLFVPPSVADLERGLADALQAARPHTGGRVFADVWDLQAFASCPACLEPRRDRLRRMNLEQRVLPAASCTVCNSTPRAV
jgi:archaeosine synthase beta-subunit